MLLLVNINRNNSVPEKHNTVTPFFYNLLFSENSSFLFLKMIILVKFRIWRLHVSPFGASQVQNCLSNHLQQRKKRYKQTFLRVLIKIVFFFRLWSLYRVHLTLRTETWWGYVFLNISVYTSHCPIQPQFIKCVSFTAYKVDAILLWHTKKK